MGSSAIGDNSTFLHLRTGRLILESGSIPSRDPYSWTAAGSPWTVQSWLPDVTYAWAWRTGGYHLLVFEQALLMLVLAVLVARLAVTGDPLRTAAAAGLALGVGAPVWSPRPLLFGLIAMAVLILVVERQRSPLWLLPVAWIWVSSHGSFPLGLAWLTLVVGGSALDLRSRSAVWIEAGRYWTVFGGGLVLAAVNPVGPRLLGFALAVGDKREVFERVVEWRSPDFHRPADLFALVFMVVALGALLRSSIVWRDVLPVLAFTGASLVAARNLPMLALVLAPALGRALAPGDGLRRIRLPDSTIIERGLLAAVLALLALATSLVFSRDPLDLRGYPVAEVRDLDARGWLRDGHLAHDDVTGGYLILRYGPDARVFYDDRFDMYPLAHSRDVIRLNDGHPEALAILKRLEVETVLWPRGSPLEAILEASPQWQRHRRSDEWVVFRAASGP